MEAKYRLVTTWPEDSVQVRDRTSNEILVEMKPHELVTMKNTFDQTRELLNDIQVICDDPQTSYHIPGVLMDRLISLKAAMEATP